MDLYELKPLNWHETSGGWLGATIIGGHATIIPKDGIFWRCEIQQFGEQFVVLPFSEEAAKDLAWKYHVEAMRPFLNRAEVTT